MNVAVCIVGQLRADYFGGVVTCLRQSLDDARKLCDFSYNVFAVTWHRESGDDKDRQLLSEHTDKYAILPEPWNLTGERDGFHDSIFGTESSRGLQRGTYNTLWGHEYIDANMLTGFNPSIVIRYRTDLHTAFLPLEWRTMLRAASADHIVGTICRTDSICDFFVVMPRHALTKVFGLSPDSSTCLSWFKQADGPEHLLGLRMIRQNYKIALIPHYLMQNHSILCRPPSPTQYVGTCGCCKTTMSGAITTKVLMMNPAISSFIPVLQQCKNEQPRQFLENAWFMYTNGQNTIYDTFPTCNVTALSRDNEYHVQKDIKVVVGIAGVVDFTNLQQHADSIRCLRLLLGDASSYLVFHTWHNENMSDQVIADFFGQFVDAVIIEQQPEIPPEFPHSIQTFQLEKEGNPYAIRTRKSGYNMLCAYASILKHCENVSGDVFVRWRNDLHLNVVSVFSFMTLLDKSYQHQCSIFANTLNCGVCDWFSMSPLSFAPMWSLTPETKTRVWEIWKKTFNLESFIQMRALDYGHVYVMSDEYLKGGFLCTTLSVGKPYTCCICNVTCKSRHINSLCLTSDMRTLREQHSRVHATHQVISLSS